MFGGAVSDVSLEVSIFLQENIQSSDGSINVNPGGRLAFGVNPPGQVLLLHAETVNTSRRCIQILSATRR